MADVRVQDCRGGVGAGVVRVAAVEAVPAEPQEPGADGDHRQVVGRVDLAVTCEPGPDHPCGDEARDTGREVDDVATREVHCALLCEPAAAPDQEGVDRVHARRPEHDERDPRLEVHATEHRAEHQDRRDRCEHELEVDEGRLREVDLPDQGYLPLSLQVVRTQHRPRLTEEVVEEARVRSAEVDWMPEAHVVAVEHPHYEDEGEGDEREHHAVHRPALLHDPAVQDDEARNAHQADEGGCCHLPRVVAGVQPRWVEHSLSFPRDLKQRLRPCRLVCP